MPDKNVQLPDGRVVAFPDSMADADIAAVIQKQFPVTKQPVTKFPDTDIPASPSRIPASMTGHPEEGYQPEDARQMLPMAGAMGASVIAGPEAGLAVRMLTGAAGAAGGSVAKQATSPGGAISPGQTAFDATAQGALPEVGASGLGWLAGKLSPAATQALARVLRLTPKAFQFGREPAQEVLERSLASGDLKEIASGISDASKQVTSQLNNVLKETPGTANIEKHALEIAESLPTEAGSRFLKVVDEAAKKLNLSSGQLKDLTAAEANLLKQEVAKSSRFVEGDLKPTIANAGRQFGGRVKDELIKLNPATKDLLESSANLTEASKGADFAVRAEKAGQGKGLMGGVQADKPGTWARALTDRPSTTQTLFNAARNIKEATGGGIANALRMAFQLIYPKSSGELE